MKLIRTFALLVAVTVIATVAFATLPPHDRAAALAPTIPAADTGASSAVAALGETVRAQVVLASLAAKYDYLDGVTVSMGYTPKGEQAVAYYSEGQIVIDLAHEASIDDILGHEVWHIIDWRDNGRLDWGEYLPPAESAAYLRK